MVIGVIIGLFVGFVFGFFVHCLLVHADDNEDLVVNKMNKELGLLLKDTSLLIDSAIPLYRKEEISRSIEYLQTEYDRREKLCMTN